MLIEVHRCKVGIEAVDPRRLLALLLGIERVGEPKQVVAGVHATLRTIELGDNLRAADTDQHVLLR
jgi:hypothetical protein